MRHQFVRSPLFFKWGSWCIKKWLVLVLTAGHGGARPGIQGSLWSAQCCLYNSSRMAAPVVMWSPAWEGHWQRIHSVGGPLFCCPWNRHKSLTHSPSGTWHFLCPSCYSSLLCFVSQPWPCLDWVAEWPQVVGCGKEGPNKPGGRAGRTCVHPPLSQVVAACGGLGSGKWELLVDSAKTLPHSISQCWGVAFTSTLFLQTQHRVGRESPEYRARRSSYSLSLRDLDLISPP